MCRHLNFSRPTNDSYLNSKKSYDAKGGELCESAWQNNNVGDARDPRRPKETIFSDFHDRVEQMRRQLVLPENRPHEHQGGGVGGGNSSDRPPANSLGRKDCSRWTLLRPLPSVEPTVSVCGSITPSPLDYPHRRPIASRGNRSKVPRCTVSISMPIISRQRSLCTLNPACCTLLSCVLGSAQAECFQCF